MSGQYQSQQQSLQLVQKKRKRQSPNQIQLKNIAQSKQIKIKKKFDDAGYLRVDWMKIAPPPQAKQGPTSFQIERQNIMEDNQLREYIVDIADDIANKIDLTHFANMITNQPQFFLSKDLTNEYHESMRRDVMLGFFRIGLQELNMETTISPLFFVELYQYYGRMIKIGSNNHLIDASKKFIKSGSSVNEENFLIPTHLSYSQMKHLMENCVQLRGVLDNIDDILGKSHHYHRELLLEEWKKSYIGQTLKLETVSEIFAYSITVDFHYFLRYIMDMLHNKLEGENSRLLNEMVKRMASVKNDYTMISDYFMRAGIEDQTNARKITERGKFTTAFNILQSNFRYRFFEEKSRPPKIKRSVKAECNSFYDLALQCVLFFTNTGLNYVGKNSISLKAIKALFGEPEENDKILFYIISKMYYYPFEKLREQITKSFNALFGGVIIAETVVDVWKPLRELDRALRSTEETKYYVDYRRQIHKFFKKYKYEIPDEWTNKCVTASGTLNEFLSNQNLFASYFRPENFYKGILVWQGAGVGKTCLAINAISKNFEKNNWNVIWVTRGSLIPEPKKAFVKDACHGDFRITLQTEEGGKVNQARLNQNKKPENWNTIMGNYKASWSAYNEKIYLDAVKAANNFAKANNTVPVKVSRYGIDIVNRITTYKKFANMTSGARKLLYAIVHPNHHKLENDPLRNTVIVFDEAHNLFDGAFSGLTANDMISLEKMIHNSYEVSGKNSCKLIFLTATPITSPDKILNFIRLLRLLVTKKDADRYLPYDSLDKIERIFFSPQYGGVEFWNEENMRKHRNEFARKTKLYDASLSAFFFSTNRCVKRFDKLTLGKITYFDNSNDIRYFPLKKMGKHVNVLVSKKQLEEIKKLLGGKVEKAQQQNRSSNMQMSNSMRERKPVIAVEQRHALKKQQIKRRDLARHCYRLTTAECFYDAKCEYDEIHDSCVTKKIKKKAYETPVNVSLFDSRQKISGRSLGQAGLNELKDVIVVTNEKIKNLKPAIVEKLRSVSNVAPYDNEIVVGREKWDVDEFKRRYHKYSPKMAQLIHNIDLIDAEDKQKHGTLFKHIIYTDVPVHLEFMASALIANGYDMCQLYSARERVEVGEKPSDGNSKDGYKTVYKIKPPDKLTNLARKTFLILGDPKNLTSPALFKKLGEKYPDTADGREAISGTVNTLFNDEKNVYGDIVRFIILDSSYKEGLSLFDVRHFWFFEEPLDRASVTQAVARGARFCGSKNSTMTLPINGGPKKNPKADVKMLDLNVKYEGWEYFIHVVASIIVTHNEDDESASRKLVSEYIFMNVNRKAALMYNGFMTMMRLNSIDYEINKDIGEDYKPVPGYVSPVEKIIRYYGIP